MNTTVKKRVILSLLASLMLVTSSYASPTKAELDSHKKIVGYFPEWGIYSAHNNYTPADTPFDKLTHINYAFARIIDGEVAIFDDWAATGVSHGEPWNSQYSGNLGQFKKFKKDFPDTSVLISVGGWTQSAGFHDAAINEVSRQKFADSCVEFIRQWDFDGVDIDWEFPTQVRQPDTIDTAGDTGTPNADAAEKQTFTLLLKTIRETLTAAGEQDGKYYQLTAAVGASVTTINNVETDKYHQYLDFINIMTYDMHGAWENKTNHQSALFSNPDITDPFKLTIDNAVKLMIKAGVPASKLVIGSPYYSRGWKGVKNNGPIDSLPGLDATATGGAKGIWDGGRAAGINPYYHIKSQMENDTSFVKYRDPYTKTPYLYSESKGEMYTYEDEVSVGVKAEYVNNNSLGGVIFWELSADFPSKGSSLTNVLFNTLLDGVHPRYTNADMLNTGDTTNNDTQTETEVTVEVEVEVDTNGVEIYNSLSTYQTGAQVSYKGVIYTSLWWTQGNTPGIASSNVWTSDKETTDQTNETDTTTDTTTTINEIDTATNLEIWNPTRVYFANDKVISNSVVYTASWWTKGNIPGSEQWGPWKIDSSSSVETDETITDDTTTDDTTNEGQDTVIAGEYPLWNAGDIYLTGDIVLYNGSLYKSQWWSSNSIPKNQKYSPWEKIGINDTTSEINDNNDTSTDVNTTETVASTVENNVTTAISSYALTLAQLSATETALTSSQLMSDVKKSIRTLDNLEVEKIYATRVENPSNVKRVESIISEADWNYVFAKRSVEYTYENFLKAVGKFPSFCGDYSDGRNEQQICSTSLATMFAHFTQETGGHTSHWDVEEWRQGLVHVREMGWNEEMRGGYNSECNDAIWQGQTWPCGEFDDGEHKSYFGRGAKQLSYNYNYGPFSEAMTGSVRTLLDNPELVADTWYNLASAVFFFVYPQPPKPSMLHVIDGTWQANEQDIAAGLTKGFGVTTQIINGGVECGGSTEIQQSLNRIEYYKNFANFIGVTIPSNEVLGCKNMQQFAEGGNGALEIYWEQDWGYDATKPEGKTYACKLVGYQTPFSAFKEGDYSQCVQKHFGIEVIQ
ncbi:glycosyl hydrolase family 18 protein [Sulfurimonas sp.]|jgi:GH18 family chitinase/chitodextrinase|uniref:glycosyl hydrolase family 18 protein n=1 Tax=Sulfurimonas sp. TaxID=2022749 RepID=UPI0025EABDDF|nr:glycosyl hydrolase family 18 protein [Sulfurimonas sp.]